MCGIAALNALEFSRILEGVGIDPKDVLMIRHTAKDYRLNRALPWLAEERRDLWLAYQRIQWPAAERLMCRAGYVASFIGQSAGQTVFAGLYRVSEHATIDREGYLAFPGNAELMAIGMQPDGRDTMLAFDLEQVAEADQLVGRLVIGWTPGRTWARWANRNAFPIQQLAPESLFSAAMPHWSRIVLDWPQLSVIPRSWSTTLAQWRGVYFVFDTDRGRGYVGSAYGSENILGRWRAYAGTAHGGNVQLKASRPEALRFSILELTAPSLDPADVIEIETSWKLRLSTRDHGLNSN